MAQAVQRRTNDMNQANRDLRIANEEMQSFTSIVSHDLRSPVASIEGFLQELRMDWGEIQPSLNQMLATVPQNPSAQAIVTDYIPGAFDSIQVSVDQMERLIGGVARVSRDGKRELSFEQIDTHRLVETVIETYRKPIKANNIQVAITGQLPPMHGDVLAVEQIFSNIIGNAIKYLDPDRPGEITIYAEQTETGLTYHVQDNGLGIADHEMDKVFQLFRRGDKMHTQGDGIGLYHIRSLIQRHGGDITFESDLGVGTTFSFTVKSQKELA